MSELIKEYPYPYNLVYQVLGREIPREELAPDLDESLEYVFETQMNGYEVFILILRFLRHMKIREICQAVSIPVVAIGGISADNILSLQNSGVVGAAVVSALFAAEDIFSAAQNLSRLTKEAFL